MNLDLIHLYIKDATTLEYAIELSIISLIFIAAFVYILIGFIRLHIPLFLIIILAINIIIVSMYCIACSLKSYEEYKNGNTYHIYIGKDKNIINDKEISKEDYIFIENMKTKARFGNKPTENELNKIEDIIFKK